MSKHTITITLKNGKALPRPAKQQLKIGDTVVYVTDPPDRPFKVVFQPSPFTGKGSRVIRDSEPRKVSQQGTFRCKCFITGRNGREVGWRPDAPQSGGEHDVKP